MFLLPRLIACSAGAICLVGNALGATLTTTNVEASGTDWTAAIWQTNGAGTAVAPVAGNAYALVFNGVDAGNARNNTRIRNPAAATATFPGDSLTINTNCELREKSGVSGVVINFPGVNGNPGLILNGGLLNAGSSYALPIQVSGAIQVTHQSYISNGAGGAGGGFNTDTGTRQWNLAGVLDGAGNMVLINNKDSVPQIISGIANTFSGQWIVQCGWLQGAGTNSLGTNSIMVSPAYTGYLADLPQATSPSLASPDANFPSLTGAIFEPAYNINSAGTLTLVNGGLMNLHQNCTFAAVTIEGESLSAGTYSYAQLASSFTNFLAGGSGSITVQSYGTPPPPPPAAPGITGQPASVNLSPGSPAWLVTMVSGTPPFFYQWQKATNGVEVATTDMGDLSGSVSNVLSFSALTTSDAGSYQLIVTNTYGAITSQVATVTVTLPSGYNPQRAGFSYSYVTNYSDWKNSYLAGNGQMGIMVFGNPLNDTIVYNDRGFTLAANTNTPFRTFSQMSSNNLATIRNDCVAGNYSTADNLAQSAPDAMAGGENNRHPGYEMLIAIPPNGPVSNYSRTCNFETGEIAINWADNEGSWTRTSFVSRRDNATVQYLPAPSNGTITCSILLTNDPGMNFPSGMTFTSLANSNYLNMRANYPPSAGSAGYEGVTRVVANGGTVSVNGSVLNISNATSVLLLTRTAKYLNNCTNQWNQELIQSQLAALPTDYNTLLAGQMATHGVIYDRVQLNLNASASDRALPNETLLAMQANSSTPVKALWERIFDGGRYYYLSSSSSNTPPDLYGLWGGDVNDAGFFAYNMDANLNLQIGGGNIGDMPEAMAGYFAINEGWRADFETNAAKLLGCRGMISAGNTPGTNGLKGTLSTYYVYQYATGEVPWLLYPFWEHYLITGDTNFLQNDLYPLLLDVGEFYEDFLTLGDTNGNYILAGSISPENQPSNVAVSLLNNSTFDISGAKFALSALIQTCNILGLQQGPDGGVASWTAILNKLPPYLVGEPNNPDGALAEWSWPGLNDNYNHRHSSQLLTVWPYGEVTPESTPALFSAAAITMAKKDAYDYENAGHGWVHSALIAAGLKNAMAVNHKILYLLQQGFYFNSLASSHYNNLGAPFCTDTCNTMPDIMTEMLVSSGPGVVELLPALPQTLNQGVISEVKCRNQVTAQNLSWNTAANSVNCTLQSGINQSITLIERSGINTISATAPVNPSPLGQIARVIQLQAGVSATITLGLGQLNLALNRPVTSSSGANTASNAVDGNIGTEWVSADTESEWIYVDLGSVMNLNGAKLTWGSVYGQSYNIQVSTDAVNWTNVFETPDGAGGVDRITFAASGRYVRMLGVQSGGSGYSLAEFEVYGNTTALIPAAPTGLTATVVSSSQINLSWGASAGATGYNVKLATVSGGPYTTVASNVTGLAYTNTGLSGGTVYYFVVTATNAYGESANSAEADAETVATTVPQLNFGYASGQIQFDWPMDHTGWRLEAQTNSLGSGLGTNWMTVFGSTATNQIFIPLDTINGSVFFRLVYP